MVRKKIGLLVMAYGTPHREEDVESYYAYMRGGMKPAQSELQALKDLYNKSGISSESARITEAQAKAITEKLNEIQDMYEFKSFIGLRHMPPYIEDAVHSMAEDGIQEAVALVLAPHYSAYSAHAYYVRAVESAKKKGIRLREVEQWYDAPGFIEIWANNIKEVYAEMTEADRGKTMLVVSAHSSPEKVLEENDPYVAQLAETAKLIAEKAGITDYVVGWQRSQNTPEPLTGPDVHDLTRQLHAEKGYKSFVYSPVGFVADHLEVLYDNDHGCRGTCEEVGANYHRPKMPNTDPLFIKTMADVVLKRM